MADSDDLHSIAREPNDVVRTERLTHHIQRIREDQMDEVRATQPIANKKEVKNGCNYI